MEDERFDYEKFTEELTGNYPTYYECLESDDLSEVVMKLYENLSCAAFHHIIEIKAELKSRIFREEGNNAFITQNYKEALEFYNMAICYAPKNSVASTLAYSNRSALLFNVKDYKGALKDIERCYSLTCPVGVMKKLKIREKKCRGAAGQAQVLQVWIDDSKSNARTSFPLHLLDLKGERNEEIPCASQAVRLDRSGPQTTLVAVRPVTPGVVLARETAFVSTVCNEDIYFLCHYCMKSSFNLIPCDNCCVAMFCDDNCKNKCVAEYHAVECQIPERLQLSSEVLLIALRAIIKMKNSYGSWENFIQASVDMEQEVNPEELFNDRHIFPLLYNCTDKSVPFGTKYNYALKAVLLLKCLQKHTTFFPLQQTKRQLAIQTTAKLLMYLSVFRHSVFIRQISQNLDSFGELYTTVSYFNFLGRLKHSCDPNLLIVPMNNEVVLVAVRPIAPGTPLTVSYVLLQGMITSVDGISSWSPCWPSVDRELFRCLKGHYHQLKFASRRPFILYEAINAVCNCYVCTEGWGKTLDKNYKLSASQKSFLQNYNVDFVCARVIFIMSNVDGKAEIHYQKICEGLRLFSDLRNTVEYSQLLLTFNACLQVLLLSVTGNKYI